jgi:hypothetical protein
MVERVERRHRRHDQDDGGEREGDQEAGHQADGAGEGEGQYRARALYRHQDHEAADDEEQLDPEMAGEEIHRQRHAAA